MKPFFNYLKISSKDSDKAMLYFFHNKEKSAWDPFNKFDFEITKENASILIAKENKLLDDKEQPLKKLLAHILGGVFLICIFIIFAFYLEPISKYFKILYLLVPLTIALMIVDIINIRNYYKELLLDLIKLNLVRKNKWYYNPNKSNDKATDLASKYHEIFNLEGGAFGWVEDEIWGNINKSKKRCDFYSGIYHNTMFNNRGSNVDKNFFIIKLNKKLQSTFFLYPEDIKSKLKNIINKKEINTESIKFNKLFSFNYNGEKGKSAQEIIKILSPAVQNKLIELREKRGKYKALFKENVVIFMFDDILYKKPYTKIFRGYRIDERDSKEVENHINTLIDISTDMVKYFE
jgi:hypothetical protein